jgi:3-dehydroquinate synthase
MVEDLTVNLGHRSYPIHFGEDLTSVIAAEVVRCQEAGAKLMVVTDESLAGVQGERIAAMTGDAPRLVVPAGETAKSSQQLAAIWDFLAAGQMDRGGVVMAVGGGVVGDLAGFAAASFLRGVSLVQVPTTLLAMVDSSVGGKTGINITAGKNLVGAFHQPQAVWIDTAFLQTLPSREFAAGMAEVIKYGLLGDAELFEQLEQTPLTVDSPELAAVVRRCCATKARIVEADEFETAASGGRALLNLGHTFGHAIEKVAGYSVYLHGEAVAIGLAAAARLSRDLGLIDAALVDRVEAVVAAHGLPTRLRESLETDALLGAMASDKKVRAGRLRFVVLEALGRAVTQEDVPLAQVESVWREVGAV